MRYGLRTHCKRRWTVQGDRPVCPVKLGYEWGYLYVALCPFDGDIFAMFFSHLDKDCFRAFLTELQAHRDEQGKQGKILLVGDGATAHTSQDWETYEHIDWLKQPTACPEVNPVERFFEELRRHTATLFESLAVIEQKIVHLIKGFANHPDTVSKLTLYPYIKNMEYNSY